jgi:hypothetical protein
VAKPTIDEAVFSVSFPSAHKLHAVDYSGTLKKGKSTEAGGGFITSEGELRDKFEHFLLDLRLAGVFLNG